VRKGPTLKACAEIEDVDPVALWQVSHYTRISEVCGWFHLELHAVAYSEYHCCDTCGPVHFCRVWSFKGIPPGQWSFPSDVAIGKLTVFDTSRNVYVISFVCDFADNLLPISQLSL